MTILPFTTENPPEELLFRAGCVVELGGAPYQLRRDTWLVGDYATSIMNGYAEAIIDRRPIQFDLMDAKYTGTQTLDAKVA